MACDEAEDVPLEVYRYYLSLRKLDQSRLTLEVNSKDKKQNGVSNLPPATAVLQAERLPHPP
jgi:hypothetical protein